MITNPITLNKDSRVYQAEELMSRYKISGLPVIEDDGKLIGIITNRDIKYRKELDQPVGDIMTSKGLITAPVGTTLEQAKEILLANFYQIFAISHQPQLSSKANSHFLVERHGESSVVRELDKEERVNELARMISGEHISEEAINFAKGLLK